MEFKDLLPILEKLYPGITAKLDELNAEWEKQKQEQK